MSVLAFSHNFSKTTYISSLLVLSVNLWLHTQSFTFHLSTSHCQFRPFPILSSIFQIWTSSQGSWCDLCMGSTGVHSVCTLVFFPFQITELLLKPPWLSKLPKGHNDSMDENFACTSTYHIYSSLEHTKIKFFLLLFLLSVLFYLCHRWDYRASWQICVHLHTLKKLFLLLVLI